MLAVSSSCLARVVRSAAARKSTAALSPDSSRRICRSCRRRWSSAFRWCRSVSQVVPVVAAIAANAIAPLMTAGSVTGSARWLYRWQALSCPERPPPGHGAHQSLGGQDAQHPGDRGLGDVVVLGQRRRCGQCLVHGPFPRCDAPPQVGGDDLRWSLWSPWHTLIIPAGDHPARPARSESLESAKSPALVFLREVFTPSNKAATTPERARPVLPHQTGR